jgi:hypothetical protein
VFGQLLKEPYHLPIQKPELPGIDGNLYRGNSSEQAIENI